MWSKRCTIFEHVKTWMACSNPSRGMDVRVCVCVRLFLCYR